MKYSRPFFIGMILLFWLLSIADRKEVRAQSSPEGQSFPVGEIMTKAPWPVVKGYGEGLFRIGKLLYRNDFENLDDWIVQIEELDAEIKPKVEIRDGTLNVRMPDRGTTIWNRHKFKGPVAIVYQVTTSAEHASKAGVRVRDINCFWHASDPDKPGGIFNEQRYTGAFGSYHKMNGYYASLGGRNNTTTRFRRYPRSIGGERVSHIALSDKDGFEDFLIDPGKTHTIQLVAYEDVIQYIVDGRVFYEMRERDTVPAVRADGGKEEIVYTSEEFPPYREGWFGFRLVMSHHLYSNFRVYRLNPCEE